MVDFENSGRLEHNNKNRFCKTEKKERTLKLLEEVKKKNDLYVFDNWTIEIMKSKKLNCRRKKKKKNFEN